MLLRVISPLLLLASWFWLPIGARPAIYSCLVVAWTVSLCSPPFSDTNQKVEFNKLNDNSAKNRQIVLALQAIVLMFLGRNLLISRTPNSSCSSTSANELDASQSSHNVHTLLISILSAVCLYVYAYAAGFTEARLTGRQPLESVLLTLPWPIGWMVNACLVVNGVALPGADHLPAPSGSHVERSLPPTPISTAGNTTTAQNMSTSTPVATVSPATSMTTAISNTGAAPVPGAAAENERFVAQYYQAVSKVGQASAQAQAVRSGSGGSTWRGDAVEIDPRSELDEHLTDGSSAHAADVRRGLVDRTTDNARQAMFAVLGYDGTDPSHVALYDHIQWRLQHTFNPAQQIGERGQSAVSVWWGGQGAKSVREFGIVLRGTCYCPQPAYRVARWLIEHNKSVGFEGLAQTSEVLHRTVETGSSNRTEVKRFKCSSGSFMKAWRDFVVVTCHSQMANGTNVLSSRSDAEDIEACSPNPPKPRPRTSTADTRGLIRGACFASGYVLHPLPVNSAAGASFEAGCEVRFACHINMRGGGSTNELRRGFLVDDVFATLMELAKLPPVPRVDMAPAIPAPLQKVGESDADAESGSAAANGSEHAADESHNSAEEPTPLSSGHLEQLRQCSLASLALLKTAHRTGAAGLDGADIKQGEDDDTEREAGPASSSGGRGRARGVTITERPLLNNKASIPSASAGTVMCATCTTAAAPAVVRRLLREHPRSVDNMLEGHRVLLTLPHSNDGTSGTTSASTYVQHLQYGSIWPIGARDFLLVTTEADYDSSGFIFASTSADHLWHSPEPGTHSEETDQSSDDSDGYTRSTLRLAGYIGEANAHGGTDLTMYVDLGLAAYVPAWLLKILGDYGLSEIMRRISLAADRAADTLALPAATDPASAAPVAVSPTVTPAKAPTHNSPPTPVSRNSPDAENDANNRFQQSDSWQLREGGEMRSHYTPSRRQSQSWCNADQEDDVFSDLTREAMENIEMYLELEVQPLTPASGSGRSKSDQQTGLNVSSLPPCVSKALKAQLQSSAPATPEHVEPLVLRWQDKGGKAGVQVSNTKVPGSDWCAVRGSVIINADKHDIRKLVMDDKRTAEYDDMFDKYTLLRQVDERTSVRLVQMKGIWPTAPREFVLLSSWAELSDGSLLIFSRSPAPEETGAAATRSKTGSLNPLAAALMETPSKGYVRGSVVVSGYHIQPIAPMIGSPSKKVGTEAKGSSAACRVTLVAHTELGGSLPSSVINSLATGAPVKLLQGLSAVLERRR